MKKTLGIILSLVLVIGLLAGCSGTTDSKETTAASGSEETQAASASIADTKVSVVIPETPDTLAPFISGQQGRDYVCQVYYQAPFDWDSANGILTPVVAESYEHTDANHTTIKIRENVHDSAGNAITASDVAFCIQGAVDCGGFQELSIVEGVEAKGDYEVEVTWNIDIQESLEGFQLAMSKPYIVNQAAYEAASDGYSSNPIGTGPYVITDFVAGNTYTFKADENYWGKDVEGLGERSKANVETITFVIVAEDAQRPVALETNVADFSSIATSDIYLFQEGGADAEDFTLTEAASVATTMLKFNCAEHIDTTKFSSEGDDVDSSDYTSVCSNVNMRKAIAYAIDVDEIIQGAWSGNATRVQSYGGGPLCCDYNEAWDSEDYYECDLDKAAEYLDKALEELGMTKDEVEIRVHCNTREVTKTVATIICNDIEKLGIKASVDSSDVRAITVDPTIWELELKDLIATSGYTPLTWTDAYGDVAWSDESVQGVYNWCFVHDDKLEEYNVNGEKKSVYSAEFLEEARQYAIYDQCYQYLLLNGTEFTAYRNSVFSSVVFGSNGVIIPQACTYTWN